MIRAAIAMAGLAGLLATGAAGAVQVTRGPYLQLGGPDRITIRWRTDLPTDSCVDYGVVPSALSIRRRDGAPTTEHEITLTGLRPGTEYFYAVGSAAEPLAGGDDAHSFVTAPPAGAVRPVRIWAIGDSGQPGPGANRVRDAFLAHAAGSGADVWLMLGDNAYTTGTDAQYQAAVFDTYAGLLRNTVLWPTRGNHDVLHAGPANDYYDIFTLPAQGEAGGVASGTEAYWSFDRANVHFVCLDSEGSDRSPAGAMATWLQLDLAATSQPWIIAYWHHPPYTKGTHDSDNVSDSGGRMRDMRANFLPILEAHGVDLVLAGHSHAYERSVLLDGHYGSSGTLLPGHVIDRGDGDPLGEGAYRKPTFGASPHEGAVYAVAGSSSKAEGGALDHPVMVTSLNALGSMVIDVHGDTMDAAFLDADGAVRDRFRLVKGNGPTAIPSGAPAASLSLDAPSPNPFRSDVHAVLRMARPGVVRLEVLDVSGRRIATLRDGPAPAGVTAVRWDGRDRRGNAVAPGTYFLRLHAHGETRVRKVVRAPAG